MNLKIDFAGLPLLETVGLQLRTKPGILVLLVIAAPSQR
jgi:hypothetical protein